MSGKAVHRAALEKRALITGITDETEAQRLMLEQSVPEDFVIATGERQSVRDFIEAPASALDLLGLVRELAQAELHLARNAAKLPNWST